MRPSAQTAGPAPANLDWSNYEKMATDYVQRSCRGLDQPHTGISYFARSTGIVNLSEDPRIWPPFVALRKAQSPTCSSRIREIRFKLTIPAEALRPLAGNGAYLLFTLGLIGVGMLGVPALAGSAAYAVAEASAWRGTLEDKPRLAIKFYAVVGVAMVLGLALNYAGVNAVKMLFWSAVLNGVLAPPLIILVVLLTSNKK
jgi:hypothetical protein